MANYINLIYNSILSAKMYINKIQDCSRNNKIEDCQFEFLVLDFIMAPINPYSTFDYYLLLVGDLANYELFKFILNLDAFWFALSLSHKKTDYIAKIFNSFPNMFNELLEIRKSFFKSLSISELLDISKKLVSFKFRLSLWVNFVFPKIVHKLIQKGYNLEKLLDLLENFSRRVSDIKDPLKFLCYSLGLRKIDASLLFNDVRHDKIKKFEEKCFRFTGLTLLSKKDIIDYLEKHYRNSVFRDDNRFIISKSIIYKEHEYFGKFTRLKFPSDLYIIVKTMMNLSSSDIEYVFKYSRKALLWRDYVELVLYFVREISKKRNNFKIPVNFDSIFKGLKNILKVSKKGKLLNVPNAYLFDCNDSISIKKYFDCLLSPLVSLFAYDLNKHIEYYHNYLYKEVSEDQLIASLYSRIKDFYRFLKDYWGSYPALFMLLNIFDIVKRYEKLIKKINHSMKIRKLLEEHEEKIQETINGVIEAIKADIINDVLAEELSDGYDTLYSIFRKPIWEKFKEFLISLISLSVYIGDIGSVNRVMNKIIEVLKDDIRYKGYIIGLVKDISRSLPQGIKNQFLSNFERLIKKIIFEKKEASYLILLDGLNISSEELRVILNKFRFLVFPNDSDIIFTLLKSVDTITGDILRLIFNNIHFLEPSVLYGDYSDISNYITALLRFMKIIFDKTETKYLAINLFSNKIRELSERILRRLYLHDNAIKQALVLTSIYFLLDHFSKGRTKLDKQNYYVHETIDNYLLLSLLEEGFKHGIVLEDLLGNFLSLRYMDMYAINGDPGGVGWDAVDISLINLLLNKLNLKIDNMSLNNLNFLFTFKSILLLKLWLYNQNFSYSELRELLDNTLKDLVLLKYESMKEFFNEFDSH